MAPVVYGYCCYEIKFCGVHEYYLGFFCSWLAVGSVSSVVMVIA